DDWPHPRPRESCGPEGAIPLATPQALESAASSPGIGGGLVARKDRNVKKQSVVGEPGWILRQRTAARHGLVSAVRQIRQLAAIFYQRLEVEEGGRDLSLRAPGTAIRVRGKGRRR